MPIMPLIRRDNVASKFKGVHKNKDRWEARIQSRVLGTFDTPEEAAGIYARAVFYLENEARLKAEDSQAPVETGNPAPQHSYPTRHNKRHEVEAAPVHHQQPATVYHNLPRLEMSSQAPVVHENLAVMDAASNEDQDAFGFMEGDMDALEMPYENDDLWGPIYEV